MNFEFLFRRAHSRSRVDRKYWSGVSLNSFTACSKEVTTGMIGPIGSGLPQFGLPRRFAMIAVLPSFLRFAGYLLLSDWIRPIGLRIHARRKSLPRKEGRWSLGNGIDYQKMPKNQCKN